MASLIMDAIFLVFFFILCKKKANLLEDTSNPSVGAKNLKIHSVFKKDNYKT